MPTKEAVQEVRLTEAAAHHLTGLLALVERAQERYQDALRVVCLQQVGLPTEYTITPDLAHRVLRIEAAAE